VYIVIIALLCLLRGTGRGRHSKQKREVHNEKSI
jgi:hypothetical protein